MKALRTFKNPSWSVSIFKNQSSEVLLSNARFEQLSLSAKLYPKPPSRANNALKDIKQIVCFVGKIQQLSVEEQTSREQTLLPSFWKQQIFKHIPTQDHLRQDNPCNASSNDILGNSEYLHRSFFVVPHSDSSLFNLESSDGERLIHD